MNSIIPKAASPTQKTYNGFNRAYDFFNARLFDSELPECLISIQRKKGAYGYFAYDRFGAQQGDARVDEIALNPSHLDSARPKKRSTLVHEMVHLWQFHFGKPLRSGYHNKEWAGKMEQVGLIPSSNGHKGGNRTGQNMTHYIQEGGAFAFHCAELVKDGFFVPYVELWTEEAKKAAKKKGKSKTKFSCRQCDQNAWGKPDLQIMCATCLEPMIADEEGDIGI